MRTHKSVGHTRASLPRYEPERWNSDPNIRNSHNCYTYFLNKIDPQLRDRCKREKCGFDNRLKPQPGHASRRYAPITENQRDLYQCPEIVERVLADNPHVKTTTRDADCGRDRYKGALVVDPGHTYHFYRQDRDGRWSHKDGSLPATRLDAKAEPIIDPATASRDYGYRPREHTYVNYTDFCGYFCVPSDPDRKFMDRITQQDWLDFTSKK